MGAKNILPIRSYTEIKLEGSHFPDEEKIERAVSCLSEEERNRLLKRFEHKDKHVGEAKDIEMYNNIRKAIKR